jgi:LPS-assembly lipoprotein
MSLFNRRIFLLSLAALGGCGFQPAYGPTGPATALRGQIRAADPTDRYGFNLVKRLEDRLDQPDNAKYALGYTISTTSEGVAITTEEVVNRYTITGKVAFTVTDTTTDTEVYSGKVDSFTSYSATGTALNTQSAARDAYDRLMTILADQIVTQLVATSASWAS